MKRLVKISEVVATLALLFAANCGMRWLETGEAWPDREPTPLKADFSTEAARRRLVEPEFPRLAPYAATIRESDPFLREMNAELRRALRESAQ